MSEWKKFVQKKYHEMKRADPDVKLGAAMKQASKEWKSMKKGGDVMVDGDSVASPAKSRKSLRRSRKSRKSRKSRR